MFLPSEALAWMGADIAKVENPKGGEALPAEAVIEDHDLIGSPLPLAYEPGARPALGQGVHLDRLGQVRTGLPAGGSGIRTGGPPVIGKAVVEDAPPGRPVLSFRLVEWAASGTIAFRRAPLGIGMA